MVCDSGADRYLDLSAAAVAFVEAADQELPPGVKAPVVSAAVDLTADGSADLLVVEFCCGGRSRRNECDYHCGETWQRLEDGWTRCSWWQPA